MGYDLRGCIWEGVLVLSWEVLRGWSWKFFFVGGAISGTYLFSYSALNDTTTSHFVFVDRDLKRELWIPEQITHHIRNVAPPCFNLDSGFQFFGADSGEDISRRIRQI